MWLARHFPGLGYRPEDVDELTPELTTAMRKVGSKLLAAESDDAWERTKVIAKSAAGVRFR